jgi:hypothetical protein
MEKQQRVVPLDLRDPKLSEKSRNRLSVLLDMNVWIDLAEGKTPQSSRLKEKLRWLVKSGKLFCPLVPTTIWELYRQSYDSAVGVAALMEELSLGLSFAPTEEIYRHEVDAAFEKIYTGAKPGVTHAKLYVPVMAFISSIDSLIFPNAALFENPGELADKLARRLRDVGLVEFCNLARSHFPQPALPPPGYAATGLRRKEIAGNSKEKIRRVEEEAVMRSIVTPRLIELRRRLPEHLQLVFHARILRLPRDRYGGRMRHLLSWMPSVEHRVEVMSLVGKDPGRPDQIRDFFDLELIMAPYVYSTVLVTRDRWIRHILRKLGGEYRGLWTHDAFEEFLDGLDSSPLPEF